MNSKWFYADILIADHIGDCPDHMIIYPGGLIRKFQSEPPAIFINHKCETIMSRAGNHQAVDSLKPPDVAIFIAS